MSGLINPLAGCRATHRRLLSRASPLAVFSRLYGREPHAFLYESLEARGTRGRYSFLGGRPAATLRSFATGPAAGSRLGSSRIEWAVRDGKPIELTGSPIEALRGLVLQAGVETAPVATFPGGAVGYLGYDVVRHFAPLPSAPADDLGVPESTFVFPTEVLVFDHRDEVVHVVGFDVDAARMTTLEEVLRDEDGPEPQPVSTTESEPDAARLESNLTRDEFEAMVEAAKDHIVRGDIFQVVLSQRFGFVPRVEPIDYYRALRRTNPSPYMYYLQLDGLQIAGSSPEVLVQSSGRRLVTRPLAGTRPRGATVAEDDRLAADLLADPKECAEHLMLVDLARNDLGRVARVGSIELEASFEIERYSRVMHITSQVSGKLRPDRDAFDVFAAAFPAGTVSGAPKVRAMQIIDDLEPTRRGSYAGAIGYFGYTGDADLCIGIRAMAFHGGRGYVQAGAGIVADSIPANEYEETRNKARGLLRAIELAERGRSGGRVVEPAERATSAGNPDRG